MSSIIQGFTNLIESIFQIIYGTISTAVSAVVNTLHAAFSLVVSLIQGVFNVSEEVIGLVLGEFRVPAPLRKSFADKSPNQATSRSS